VKTIKQLRISRGLTQKEFARMLGTNHARVCMWEQRKVTPRLRYAYQIAQLFGLEMDELDYERQVPNGNTPATSSQGA
jgi:transcriptional regulator with XRE-family HTH domain